MRIMWQWIKNRGYLRRFNLYLYYIIRMNSSINDTFLMKKKYACSFCNFLTHKKYNLDMHKRNLHSDYLNGDHPISVGAHFSNGYNQLDQYTQPKNLFPSPQQQEYQPIDSEFSGLNFPYDVRLKENFKLFISGPSRCGKTFFVANLLQNIESFAKMPPKKIIYIYKVWQSKFDEMRSLVHVFLEDCESIVGKIQERATGEPMLVIFDDLINSKSLVDIATLFTVDGRHMNMSMVFLTQRMFVNNEHFRQISQNCDYFAIFKNPRNSSEVRMLAQQLTPGSLDLIDIYMQATQDPFSYLFINLTQECPPQVKYLSKLFDYDNSIKVYCTFLQDSKMRRKTNFKEMLLVDNTLFKKFKEMFFAENLFHGKVNNENHISITNSFSPVQGREVLGTKDDECKECASSPTPYTPLQPNQPPPTPPRCKSSSFTSEPLVTDSHPQGSSQAISPLQPSEIHPNQSTFTAPLTYSPASQSRLFQMPSRPLPSIQSQPGMLPSASLLTHSQPSTSSQLPTVPSYLSGTYPGLSASTPLLTQSLASRIIPSSSEPLPYQPPSPLYGIKPFESEAHRWIDNVATQHMDVDQMSVVPQQLPLVPQHAEEDMDLSSQYNDQPQALKHQHQPQALQYQPQALSSKKSISYSLWKPVVELQQEPVYPLTTPTSNEYSYYTCTICNTNFNKRNALERHMKNIHDAYQQKVKGAKRKIEREDRHPRKYVKW